MFEAEVNVGHPMYCSTCGTELALESLGFNTRVLFCIFGGSRVAPILKVSDLSFGFPCDALLEV